MYTYNFSINDSNETWGNGNATYRLAITNTETGETKVCDDFTYLDDAEQDTLEWLFINNFEK
tara:strand:- start:45 stop:230 length:186 start_codon:yes stop_codon:yes gene_type:complete